MRRRTWNVLAPGIPVTGGEEDLLAAQALASIANAETIRSFIDVVTALDRFGGEATMAAYRFRFDAEGRRVEGDEVGSYRTAGYLFSYKPVADETRFATDAPVEADQGLDTYVPLNNEISEDEPEVPDEEPAVTAGEARDREPVPG